FASVRQLAGPTPLGIRCSSRPWLPPPPRTRLYNILFPGLPLLQWPLYAVRRTILISPWCCCQWQSVSGLLMFPLSYPLSLFLLTQKNRHCFGCGTGASRSFLPIAKLPMRRLRSPKVHLLLFSENSEIQESF